VTGTPLLTRRLLVLEYPCWPKEESEAERLWRIPVLGLGTFGVQVLRTLAATRPTTALEWLPATLVPWTVRACELAFVVADWREEASARHAAQLAGTCRAHGCFTIAIGPVPCGCPEYEGAVQAELGLVRPWVDCLVTSSPTPDHQTGPCRPGGHAALAQAHRWAAQMIDGIADFLRADMLCVDLTDLELLFTRSGRARAGIGCASGPDRLPTALHRALAGPWLEATTLAVARRVLIMVTGSPDLTLHDLHETVMQVQTLLSPEARWLFGGLVEPQAPPETLQVMLLAGGLDLEATATGGTCVSLR
jgi:cell division protein FtsZ